MEQILQDKAEGAKVSYGEYKDYHNKVKQSVQTSISAFMKWTFSIPICWNTAKISAAARTLEDRIQDIRCNQINQ